MSLSAADICQRCLTTHPLNDEGQRPCPKPPVEEKPAGLSVIFKGGGWYCKDSVVIKSASEVM